MHKDLLIPPSPPPKPRFLRARVGLIWMALIGVLTLAGLVGVTALRWQNTLAADTTIEAGGIFLTVADVEMRPLGAEYAIVAAMDVIDVPDRQRAGFLGAVNSICQSLIESEIVSQAASDIFRVTLDLLPFGGTDRQIAIVGVYDGRCAAHVQNNQFLYTMPGTLQGWILSDWRNKGEIFGTTSTIQFTFVPRVDADPDLYAFDFDFACQVLMADWPVTVPIVATGRNWTDVEIIAKEGVQGRSMSYGRLGAETYAIDDPRCIKDTV